VAGFAQFLRGIANGTQTPTTQNFTQCEVKVTEKWDLNFKRMVNQTRDGNVFDAGWTLLDMIYNVHNITSSCGTGVIETINGISYLAGLQYPSSVIDNVVFHFGDIFDALRNTMLYFDHNPRGDFNVPYDAGMGLGHAIYETIQPPYRPKRKHPY
jgi:hypothetical protein